ncbi:MAG TPA: phage major capsid protein [Hyphomicrobiaceae bacterium]|jgi:HK97 family phage major capsid protein|nr:phage major capsid protein [Hyphomicrobiaceae bacterium]
MHTDSLEAAFGDFMRTFEAFKEGNDERLSELERRTSADVVTTEKVDRLNRAIDETRRVVDDLALKSARPHLGGPGIHGPRSSATLQHKAAFDTYVRKGDATELRDLEVKALSVGSDPDGGYLVPEELEARVNRGVRNVSPIRAIAGIRRVSGSVYKKPFAITGAGAGWIAEAAARPETATPTLAELAFPTMELYAMPAATSALLDDSAVDIDEWIADEVRDTFATQEGTAFVTGNGTARPKGFLDYTKVANPSWTWGNIGYITTGTAGAFPASNAGDKLIDLVYTVKSGYRSNGTFVFNRATQAVIRKMKDADGSYLWQPADKAGEASTLMGFPVAESEDMPNIATDSYSVAFGDFRRGYLIVDRAGIRVLRDPYSSKPYVLFYTTKRVGGGVQDFDAIKLLRFSV